MFTQKKQVSSRTTSVRQLHSLHVLPNGRDLVGQIEVGRAAYQFTFKPQRADINNDQLTLNGSVIVRTANGQSRTAQNVTATLLATQGSISAPSPYPLWLSETPKPKAPDVTLTDWSNEESSVAVLYFKLTTLDGRALGVPLDLSALQLNARFYPTSDLERELHWIFSALAIVTHSETKNATIASRYLKELNRVLQS
jgi:hypothetical protein